MENNKCKWSIRPGTNNSFWAFTPCKPGFNYLSKVNKNNQKKPTYDNHTCPICGKRIECNMELIYTEENMENHI